jgi:hypothetical protein
LSLPGSPTRTPDGHVIRLTLATAAIPRNQQVAVAQLSNPGCMIVLTVQRKNQFRNRFLTCTHPRRHQPAKVQHNAESPSKHAQIHEKPQFPHHD